MIIPVRFKKMFEGGAEAGITNVLHVNAEHEGFQVARGHRRGL